MSRNEEEARIEQPSSELERRVSEALTEGEMWQEDAEKLVREKLAPKYEVRIQATVDPIVEETIRYRQLAEEVDQRYDKYMDRAAKKADE